MPYLARAGHPRIHYTLDDFTDPWKKAPVLILQHGYSRSGQYWYPWVPYLARHFRVVRPDLRGLGRSDPNFDLEKQLSVEAYIGDLKALIAELGGGPVHYCGESLAGIIGMVLAAEHPELVRTLSLVAAPILINKETQKAFAFEFPSWAEALRTLGPLEWAKRVNGATRFPAGSDPSLLEWYAAEGGKCNVDVMIAMSRLAAGVDATPYLPRIKAPVLGLYPSPPPVTIAAQEKVLRDGIPDLRIVHVPSAFHAIMNILPATCARQVLYHAARFDGTVCDEA